MPAADLQHLGAEMLRTAIAGRAIGQARIGLGVGDELGERLRRNRRVDDQRERHAGDQRDRREILHGIVGQLLVERLVDRKRGRGRHQERVAVGLGSRDLLGAERGAGARLVLDHDDRVQPALDLVGDQPAEQIGGAAGRIRHDHLDVAARIGRLRQRRPGRQHDQPPPHPDIACRRVNSWALPMLFSLRCCEPL